MGRRAHLPQMQILHGMAPWLIQPVCTENLNPDVVVMKSAKDRV
jgi:hypothetical protein